MGLSHSRKVGGTAPPKSNPNQGNKGLRTNQRSIFRSGGPTSDLNAPKGLVWLPPLWWEKSWGGDRQSNKDTYCREAGLGPHPLGTQFTVALIVLCSKTPQTALSIKATTPPRCTHVCMHETWKRGGNKRAKTHTIKCKQTKKKQD